MSRSTFRRCLLTLCTGLLLFSGCVETAAPRGNPFETASAKLKQTLFGAGRPATDKAQSKSSANQSRGSGPTGATPMLYQQPAAAVDSRLPVDTQLQWQRSPDPIAQAAYQVELQSRSMAQSPPYGQYPDVSGGPARLPFEQPAAYEGGNPGTRPDAQASWQQDGQPIAQAAYYGAPQDENYGYPLPDQDYLYPPQDGMPYAPLQYPAVELPSQSRFMRYAPPPVAVENGQPMNPYPAQVQNEWADQAAPAMAPGEMEYLPAPTMMPPQQAMPYPNQGQMDPLLYVDSLRPSSNAVMGSGSGHLADGIGLRGSVLRQTDQTATEIAIDLDMQNQTLREQHKKISQNIRDLEKELEDQQLTNKKTQQQLLESNRRNTSLQEEIARLRVQVQDLEREKETIQKNADMALREIESQLDTMLLSTMSKSQEPPTEIPRN